MSRDSLDRAVLSVPVESVEKAGSDAHSPAVVPFDEVVSSDSPKEFMEAIASIDWSSQSPSELREAIDLAFQLGCHSVAIELASEGHKLFPHDLTLERIARVLAPPKLVRTGIPAIPGLRDSVEWFEKHREQYSGKWVAIRNGKLLASADSRAELSRTLDSLNTLTDVLVAKVP